MQTVTKRPRVKPDTARLLSQTLGMTPESAQIKVTYAEKVYWVYALKAKFSKKNQAITVTPRIINAIRDDVSSLALNSLLRKIAKFNKDATMVQVK